MEARFFCAAGVKADAPVAKATLTVCGPGVSGCLDACCTEFSLVSPLSVPVISPGAGASRFGGGDFANNGAAFANDGAAGGREDVISGRLPLVTLGFGFAVGTGAVAFFAIFSDFGLQIFKKFAIFG